jgi:hypothetical protein
MCPVSVSLSCPLARSQSLMVRSDDPVANHSLEGSKATLRTHPRWPEMTRYMRQGACHAGRGHLLPRRRDTAALLWPLSRITSITARCEEGPAAAAPGAYGTSAPPGPGPAAPLLLASAAAWRLSGLGGGVWV